MPRAERRPARAWLGALLLGLLAGCQTEPTLKLADIGAGAERLELKDTAFFPDEARYGAAAALATLLYTDGVRVGPEAIEPKLGRLVAIPELNTALAEAAMSLGRFPYPLEPKPDSVIAEVRAGHPVLVLLNLAGAERPQWRYAVLVGYEPATETLLFRSGKEGRVRYTPDEFLARWKDGGRLAWLIGDGQRVPATATAERWIAASEATTRYGRPELAVAAAKAARAKWPEDLLPWVALGNAQYAAKDFAAAEAAYVQALKLRDDNPVVHNNLALTLLERRCVDLAEREVQKAIAGETDPALKRAYAQTADKISRFSATAIYCPSPLDGDQAPIEYEVLPLNPETPRAPRAPRSRKRN